MTDLSSSFLADIRANPHDDGLRLIFADYCEENGEEARAQFIRLQIEAAPIEKWLDDNEDSKAWPFQHMARLEEIEKQVDELLYKHGHRWATPLAKALGLGDPAYYGHGGGIHGISWEWRRGFVHGLRLPLSGWLEHGPSLVRSHPLERVGLTDKRPLSYRGTLRLVYAWAGGEGSESSLPDNVFLRLDWNSARTSDPAHSYSGWATADQAHDALSDALLAWAKATQ